MNNTDLPKISYEGLFRSIYNVNLDITGSNNPIKDLDENLYEDLDNLHYMQSNDNEFLEEKMQNSYLSKYSTTKTIKEGFEKFFNNIKWISYKEENNQYVKFEGECTVYGEKASAIVIFYLYNDDSGNLQFVILNDIELGYSLYDTFFYSIFWDVEEYLELYDQ